MNIIEEFIDVEKEVDGVTKTERVKQIKRVLKVRQSVIDRQNWTKFGEVKNIPKGQHFPGEFTIASSEYKIERLGANKNDEIDLVKKLDELDNDKIKQKKEKDKLKMLQEGKPVEIKQVKEETGAQKLAKLFEANRENRPSVLVSGITPLKDVTLTQGKIQEQKFQEYITEFIKNKFKHNEKIIVRCPISKYSTTYIGISFVEFQSQELANAFFEECQDLPYEHFILNLDWPKSRRQ